VIGKAVRIRLMIEPSLAACFVDQCVLMALLLLCDVECGPQCLQDTLMVMLESYTNLLTTY